MLKEPDFDFTISGFFSYITSLQTSATMSVEKKGSSSSGRPKAIIVGAGIGGCASAARLTQGGFDVTGKRTLSRIFVIQFTD